MLYDRTDAESILNYAKQLIGMTFLEVIYTSDLTIESRNQCIQIYGNPRRKGGLGNLLEELYFKYKANSDSRADFHEVGIELKVSPYEISKKNEYRVGERLVLTMIDYRNPVEQNMFSSHLWDKIQKILLIYYLRDKSILNNLEYRIDYTGLFTPSEIDLKIIEEDYLKIISKIMNGKAHELSESDTIYLSACTKGATSLKSLVPQYYNSSILAKRRAFSFKPSYMNAVLNDIIFKHLSKSESIISDKNELGNQTFEDFILTKLNKYKGMNDEYLCNLLGREYNNNKAQWIDLSYRMLGIKSNRAEEFVKANIVVKSIRLEDNNTINENISFPAFRFKELIKEDWENSTVYNYFEETKFLFFIYKKQNNQYIFDNAKFWNMATSDLETDVKNCWEQTINKIKTGVSFRKSGKRIFNDLPSSKDNRIMHVRPHATKSAYRLNDGTEIGNVERDANELPDGQWMTHQCFWLNSNYIIEQLF
jgi:DNA mismatch repair protein MutH